MELRYDDLVMICPPHAYAGLTGLLRGSCCGLYKVAIEFNGELKEVEVPYGQIKKY